MTIALFRHGEDPKVMALATARAEGCTCDPEIELVEIEPDLYSARVAHDDWCALLRAEDRN